MSKIADKHAVLIDRLYDQTQKGKLDWEIDPFSKRVAASVGSYMVELHVGTDGNGNPIEISYLKNGMGEVIEQFTDEELQDYTPGGNKFNTYWKKMEALRLDARRIAMGAEQAVDDILSSLDDDEHNDN
jgi:hypothetical protein